MKTTLLSIFLVFSLGCQPGLLTKDPWSIHSSTGPQAEMTDQELWCNLLHMDNSDTELEREFPDMNFASVCGDNFQADPNKWDLNISDKKQECDE